VADHRRGYRQRPGRGAGAVDIKSQKISSQNSEVSLDVVASLQPSLNKTAKVIAPNSLDL
jgi:hypothetical protein